MDTRKCAWGHGFQKDKSGLWERNLFGDMRNLVSRKAPLVGYTISSGFPEFKFKVKTNAR